MWILLESYFIFKRKKNSCNAASFSGGRTQDTGHKTQDGCVTGVLMTVIYKHSARQVSLNQQHNGTRSTEAQLLPEERGSPLRDGRRAVAVASGTGRRLPVPGPPTADKPPCLPGRGGLTHRLDLESGLFSCLFVVWLKRLPPLAGVVTVNKREALEGLCEGERAGWACL